MQQVSLPLGSTVIILKKMQGGVWREAGRTSLCPTPEWLLDQHGQGEFELRLKRGNRVLCMVGVKTPLPAGAERPSSPAQAQLSL